MINFEVVAQNDGARYVVPAVRGYLPYISSMSPLYLPYISPTSPLYLARHVVPAVREMPEPER